MLRILADSKTKLPNLGHLLLWDSTCTVSLEQLNKCHEQSPAPTRQENIASSVLDLGQVGH